MVSPILLSGEQGGMLRTCFRPISPFLVQMALGLLLATTAAAQQPAGTLKGTVLDESGALVEGAKVSIRQGQTVVRQLLTDGSGDFSASGLAPGEYSIEVSLKGFADFESGKTMVAAGRTAILSVTLRVKAEKQQVTVVSDQTGQVSLAPSENAGSVTLRGTDLETLPDDSEDLAEDLNALAGAPVGGSGTEFYVDGFSNGRVPPKSSIREVRINQNPFSAEYDKVGFGRVEILTKPGSDQLHGTLAYRMSRAALNSRNPYSPTKPDYQANLLGGELSGPLSKRASFFLNVEGRRANDNVVVNATVLSPSLLVTPFNQAFVVPAHEMTAGGRIDYQLSEKHSLAARYSWSQLSQDNAGVGGFTLPSQAYALSETTQTVQLTETALLTSRTVNETRLQFTSSNSGRRAASFQPVIQVLESFTDGGAQVGDSLHSPTSWELQNNTTMTRGTHTLRFGGRVRTLSLYDRSPRNFGGTFIFSGGLGPELDGSNHVVTGPDGLPVVVPVSSIERYRRTLLFQQLGYGPAEVRALGGGASQFSRAGGRPASSLMDTDLGLFVQDDWRMTPTLSLSAGLRWEGQSDIHDWKDLAPRFGLAWMPGTHGGKAGTTVIRLGAGVFYDRFGDNQMLQALRFNGHTQQQFVVDNPSFFPQVPSIPTLETLGLPQALRQVDPNLRSAHLVQFALGIEHQLPMGMVAAFTAIDTRARHLYLSRNIAAPYLGEGVAGVVTTASTPAIYQYESAGTLNQDQFVASLSRRFRGRIGVFGRYTYSRAFSNTDGPDSFPANQFDLSANYGHASTDIRHNLVVGGSLLGPLRLNLNPFLAVRSGAPFDITTGHDNNHDTLFTDRPALATNRYGPDVVATPYGAFDTRPASGATIIPHNFGQGPGFVTLNLRLSRTFGLGGRASAGIGPTKTSKRGSLSGFGALSEEPHGSFHDSSTEHRFNLTLAVIVRNVLNTTNPGMPIGNLSSTYFNQSTWLASSSGPEDAAYGNNRRIQFQVRLSF